MFEASTKLITPNRASAKLKVANEVAHLYPYNTPLQIILQPPNKFHLYSHDLNYVHPTKHTQKKITLKMYAPN